MRPPLSTSLEGRALALAVGAASALVFWRTAFPTITWWDSSSYSLAAATLGIGSAPGSLILTLLGWPVARLATGSPAYALNLFAGALAGMTVGLICLVALRMARVAGDRPGRAAGRAMAAGVGAGALTFAFSGTLWVYAVRFTPYVLTPVFTGFILLVMLRWWELAGDDDAWRWILVLTLLFGLDFSVHRTNGLLIPGAIGWIAIRRPSTLLSPRAVAAALSGLVIGLSVQLLVIPIAEFTRSPLNFNDPSSWSRFWDYVTLQQLGGSFLLGVFPRKADWWSVQTLDVLRTLRDNFLDVNGPLGAVGAVPAAAAMVGLVSIWRRDRRLGSAVALVVVSQVVFTVLYFNIPANFFRTFDRHYLPIAVTIAVPASYGFGEIASWAVRRLQRRPPTWTWPSLVAVAASLGVAAVPVRQLVANWDSHDESRRFFARDYAVNALSGLPAGAIYFTVGDNDTFPVMYMQSVEGVRPDVTIINLSVANIPRWPEQLRRRDPTFPLALTTAERMRLAGRSWGDTTLVLPVRGQAARFGLPSGTPIPASITLAVRPAYGTQMLPSDVLLLDIAQTNAWQRPLTFAVTAGRSSMGSLGAFGRPEGFYYRVMPVRDPPVDVSLLRRRLLSDANFRGYADPAIRLDVDTQRLGLQAYAPVLALLAADVEAGDSDRCRADRTALLTRLPLDRLRPRDVVPGLSEAYTALRDQIESACPGATR